MDLDPQALFNSLNEFASDEQNGPGECSNLLSTFKHTLTEGKINSSLIDRYLFHIFDKSNGFLNFVKTTFVPKFSSAIIHIFEILITLINNFSEKLTKNILVVNEICMIIVKSSLTQSPIKVKALECLTIGFDKCDACLKNQDHYNELYRSLNRSLQIDNKSSSAKENILIALGMFAKKFSYLIQNKEELKAVYISHLKNEVIKKDISAKMITGIYVGLDYYCESFPLHPENDNLAIKELFKNLLELKTTNNRIKVCNRAALYFLSNNINLFSKLIFAKCKTWHSDLLNWFYFGQEERKIATVVIESLYKGMSKLLLEENRKSTGLVMYFLDYFKETIRSGSTYKKRTSIQGLTIFAEVFYKYLTAEEMENLFAYLIQNFFAINNISDNPYSDNYEYWPDYLRAIAKYLQFKKINHHELLCFEQHIVNMIKQFPKISYSDHNLVFQAFVSTLQSFKSNDDDEIFDHFVETFVFHGVVWCCSHEHITAAETMDEGHDKVITIKNYLPLWRGLLRIVPVTNYDKAGIYINDRKIIVRKLIEKLVQTLIDLLNKLNVKLVKEPNLPLTEIESAFKCEQVNDFAIFLNVVDFYRDIFLIPNPTYFKKYISKLIHELIIKCMKYPLISGFYKMLSYCLNVAEKINYFDESNADTNENIRDCRLALLRFLEVLLPKTRQFKDELLIACLQVMLEYPTVIISEMLPVCVPAFNTIFYVGRSNVQIAEWGLKTLEQWQKQISSKDMDLFIIEVIPALDSYLRSKSLGGLNKQFMEERRRKTAQPLKRRRIVTEIEPELVELQRKILNFIGQQNGLVCRAFVTPKTIQRPSIVSDHIKITLPYGDFNVDIALDQYIPKLVDLAIHSSDRKVRVTSCELLQACVMVFLGTAKTMNMESVSKLSELLNVMAFPLLQLGCHSDQIVQQIFQPLFLQMIHWYTHRLQSRSAHTGIIIDAIMEGITHPTDSALRDFSGKCICEFVKWTIKQSRDEDLIKDPINVKALMRKMIFFSTHLDSCKKLGAALIFNNIYRELLERREFLSIFWVEYLHIFITSLSLIEIRNMEDEIAIEQICAALTHIQDVFIANKSLFNSGDENRRIPIDIKGQLLKDVACWILKLTGSQNPECRKKCMELFCSIAPHTDCNSLKAFIDKYVGETDWISTIYLLENPTLENFNENESSKLFKWMRALHCALDGYLFVIKNHLGDCNLSSSLIIAIDYFLKNLQTRDEFKKEKTKIMLKLLQLCDAILENQNSCKNFQDFFVPDFCNFIINFIFNPQSLGVDSYEETHEKEQILAKFITTLYHNVPENRALELSAAIKSYIELNNITSFNIKDKIIPKDRNTINGLILLQKCNVKYLDINQLTAGCVENILQKIHEMKVIAIINIPDTNIKYFGNLLEFSLVNSMEFENLINYLYLSLNIEIIDTDGQKEIDFGIFIFSTFDNILKRKLIDNFELFMNIAMGKNQINQTIKLILGVVDYLKINRHSLQNFYDHVVHNILHHWKTFEGYFNDNLEIGIKFLQSILPMSQNIKTEKRQIKNWLIHLLPEDHPGFSYRDQLDLKTQFFYLLVEVVENEQFYDSTLSSAMASWQEKFFSKTASMENETKLATIQNMFNVIPDIKSCQLLVNFLDIHLSTSSEANDSVLESKLGQFIRRASDELQETSLDYIYKICFIKVHHGQYKLFECCRSIFQNCRILIIEEFFVKNIHNIIAQLSEKTTESYIKKKTINLQLVEILCARIVINSTGNEVSPMVQQLLENDSIIWKKLFKITRDSCKEQIDLPYYCAEQVRLYKCRGYNALVSVVSNSMRDAIFYNCKLFIGMENNVDVLWKNVVDLNKTFNFAIDFDTIPAKKKVLVNIRNEMKAQVRLGLQSKSVQYLESQHLFNSSLSDDITKYDFTYTNLRSQPSSNEQSGIIDIQSEIELEDFDINKHECMATVCGLIEHIFRVKITELPSDGEEPILPPWANGIISILMHPTTHVNIKIFWVKVIDNCSEYLKFYAKFFLLPLLKFLVDKCAGDSINYFVADLISLLAKWSNYAIPTEENEISLASQLLRFLIVKIDNEKTNVLKYNLELLKLLVQSWKFFITVPYEEISSKFNAATKNIEIGIHVASIFLANKIAVWQENTLNGFYNKLFEILFNNSTPSTYRICAETIGMMLNCLNGFNEEIVNKLNDLLMKIYSIEKNGIDKYVSILQGITLHYPQVANEQHLNRIFSIINAVKSHLKLVLLKIILSWSEVSQTIDDFLMENWDKHLQTDKIDIQIVVLKIIANNIDTLSTSSRFRMIIEAACKSVSSTNVLCRNVVYDIAIYICKNRSLYGQVFDLCKNVAVEGLIDTDPELRGKLFQFWGESANLPLQISERLPYILSNLYKTNTESNFLGYTTYLLLDVIKNRDEFNQKLFDYPLEDCNFEGYELETNWRIQHKSVVPMFAETISSYSVSMGEYSSRSTLNELRQTQSSRSTESTHAAHLTQITSMESSLLIKSDYSSNFINPNLVVISQEFKDPKRRFLKNKDEISRGYARREVQKNVAKSRKVHDLTQQREKKVTIYRKYRKGDLPDIEIPLSAVLTPLQMLALCDSDISKIFFTSIFKKVVNKIGDDGEFFNSISGSIKFIFTNSNQFNTSLFRTLLDIILNNNRSIKIEPDLLSSVCQSSGLVAIGTLLLEEYIRDEVYEEDILQSKSKRSKGANLSTTINCWVKLAELYKEINDWDAVKAIFLEKMGCKETVGDALHYESDKQWTNAQKCYADVIQTDDSYERRDFYYESYFRCFAHLGKWQDIPEEIENILTTGSGQSPWDCLWDQDWNQQKLLPWYVRAQVKSTLFTQISPDEFLDNINTCFKNCEKREYLKTNFSEELCLLWIFKTDADTARIYLREYIDNFLDNWQLLDPMFSSLRYNKLLKLRNIIDINKFLDVFDHLDINNDDRNLNDLVAYWEKTTNENLPSILLCETRTLYRRQFITLLMDKVDSIKHSNLKQIVNILCESKYRHDLDIINNAINQKNYYMARKYYMDYNGKDLIQFKLPLSKLEFLKVSYHTDENTKLKLLLQSSENLEALLTRSDDMLLKLNANIHLFNIFQHITDLLQNNFDLFHKTQSDLVRATNNIAIVTPDDVLLHAVEKLKSFVNNFEIHLNGKMELGHENLAATYLKLSYFAKERGDNKFSSFILFVLRAMKWNSSEARQLFPCILMKANFSEHDKHLFITESENVPVWMFLGWIPQLLTNIDTVKVSVVAPIILNISKNYPQAIMYAYRLSKEKFSLDNSIVKQEAEELIEKLDNLLIDERTDLFLKALHYVTIPHCALRHYLRKLHDTCEIQDVNKFNETKNAIVHKLFSSDPDSQNENSMQGNIYKQIRTYQREFEKLSCNNWQTVINGILKINEKLKYYLDHNTAQYLLLKDYCPWLASFSADKLSFDLEIPGQYDGSKMPLVKHHIKLAGFCPNVKVMMSIRRPIKLTILGNNTKEYPFLIKFGEDIRQDQRIEQVFILMNNIFVNDSACNQRELSILTYQVIPLNTDLGIIQWINDAVRLDDFVLKSCSVDLRKMRDEYTAWIKDNREAARNYSKEKVNSFYCKLVNKIPWDVFRTSFWKFSINTENFLALRNNFIKSYATMCVGHWILGIGDRHLQNSLICVKTGKILGIDFGHAFGTATQLLSTPELVPFRLTPHIIELMKPLGENGVFREIMIHCMRSLRANSCSLLATMNVFIEEPSIDWLEYVKRTKRYSGHHEWHPVQKIEQAKMKLEGANSASIMIEELNANSFLAQYSRDYVRLVKATPGVKERANKVDNGLEVEDQIDCLIDHATDYNLLGRMHYGWTAWI